MADGVEVCAAVVQERHHLGETALRRVVQRRELGLNNESRFSEPSNRQANGLTNDALTLGSSPALINACTHNTMPQSSANCRLATRRRDRTLTTFRLLV